jgi:hypothetical protein|tara:strand:+ start:155 stop:511 length:357 start_codon:yes stop_codon:yes gene_type:complete
MGVYKEVLINIETKKGFDEVIKFIREHPEFEEHTIKPYMEYIIETLQNYLEDHIGDEMLVEDYLMGYITNKEYQTKRSSFLNNKVHHLSELFGEVIQWVDKRTYTPEPINECISEVVK